MSPNALGSPLRPPALAWLGLALAALAVSGVFAALLVGMRAPGLSGLLPPALFPAALALHVNLAFVVWFLAMAGTFFSLRRRPRPAVDRAAFALAAGGALALVASALAGGRAVMNNYLPVLGNPLFGAALVVFFAGVALAAAATLLDRPALDEPERLGTWLAAGTTLLAVSALAASFTLLPEGLGETARWEAVFWAGGHLLQFTHTVLLLTTWLALGRASGVLAGPPGRLAGALLLLAALPALLGPIGFAFPLDSPGHRSFHTTLMRWGTWPAVPGVLALLVSGWARHRPSDAGTRPLRIVLALSATIFALGLVVGAFIRSDSLLVTAHYHATVGAVTLAYMGWARLLAGRLGIGCAAPRVALVQAAVFGGGLLLLVGGLAASGANGLPRKTPEALYASQGWAQTTSLSLVAGGGLVAVAGVAIFLGSSILALRRTATRA